LGEKNGVVDVSSAPKVNEEKQEETHNYEQWSKGRCRFRCSPCELSSNSSAAFWRHVRQAHAGQSAADFKGVNTDCLEVEYVCPKGCTSILHDQAKMTLEAFYHVLVANNSIEDSKKVYSDEELLAGDDCLRDQRDSQDFQGGEAVVGGKSFTWP